MRKTDVRKWIHAVLDMLPLIVIPVFMVYSHRHTIDNYSLQVEETKVVEFNQLVTNGNFSDYTDWFSNGGDFTIFDNSCYFLATGVNGGLYHNISLLENHKYY